MHTTEAWVLHEGSPDRREPATLRRESFSFADLADDEALVEPIYGCWEGNMAHAIDRQPIDICRARREPRVVLGNSGVVRVLRTGRNVKHIKIGDLCMLLGVARPDAFGYMEFAHGYDAPGTIGLLAKQSKLAARMLFAIPPGSRHTPAQWAAFTVRYMTAWSNWRVAFGALRLQLSEEELPSPHVWGWGGGTTLAELDLARRFGCKATMVTGSDAHRREIAAAGIDTVDRREFSGLQFDPARYESDASYAAAYRDSEARFLSLVRDRTRGEGVSIFLDYIGTPVIRATLKALGRQGVIATAGWKCGMETTVIRAIECLKRHTHVYTHYARLAEAPAAIDYAERNGWMPALTERAYSWDEIPLLASEFAAGETRSYFPIFAVNLL
jgi:NADPH:quinone reductase-like Zn-dependent oxidoreductase